MTLGVFVTPEKSGPVSGKSKSFVSEGEDENDLLTMTPMVVTTPASTTSPQTPAMSATLCLLTLIADVLSSGTCLWTATSLEFSSCVSSVGFR